MISPWIDFGFTRWECPSVRDTVLEGLRPGFQDRLKVAFRVFNSPDFLEEFIIQGRAFAERGIDADRY